MLQEIQNIGHYLWVFKETQFWTGLMDSAWTPYLLSIFARSNLEWKDPRKK